MCYPYYKFSWDTERKKKIMQVLEGTTLEEAEKILSNCTDEIRTMVKTTKIKADETNQLVKQIEDSEESAKKEQEKIEKVREEAKELQKDLEETRRGSRQSFWTSLLVLVFVIIWAIIRILT